MMKIMLVEDDKNLSAIYRDRLLAEGYDIVSAHDGEEALAMAVKEKPNLIIADVMMPKISGFDMLDILRSTPETKDTKVIIMTALSQVEDQQRATQLGADKYLVKSQVTLDDVARVVREVLGADTAQQAAPSTEETIPNTTIPEISSESDLPTPTNPIDSSMANPATAAPEAPVQQDIPPTSSEALGMEMPAESVSQEKQEIEAQIEQMANSLPAEPQATDATVVMPETASTPEFSPPPAPEQQVAANNQPDIMALYEKEIAKESEVSAPPINQPSPQTTDGQPTDPHSSIAL